MPCSQLVKVHLYMVVIGPIFFPQKTIFQKLTKRPLSGYGLGQIRS